MSHAIRSRRPLAAACLLDAAFAAPASAQYFGQSKVQYRAFKFQVLKTEHFDVYFYPAERAGAALSARLAERWYARLSRVFKHDLTTRQPLILYASHAERRSLLDRVSLPAQCLLDGAVDPTSGVVEPVGVFTTGKNINPQWSPDGSALYFLSDRDGVPNVYRVTLATGELAQLTRVGTGVTGITPSSPALSVAQRTGVAAFSVLQSGKYDICTLELAGAGTPLEPVAMNAAILPPTDRKSSDVAALLADATLGLPPPQEYPVEGYRPGLSLESVGQPMIAVGVSRFGASFGGGVSMYFRDMLGNRLLATAVQFNSGLTGSFSLKDTAAQAGYFNQAHRWNWGVVAGQMPYLSGGYQSRVGVLEGEPVVVDDLIVYRQTERSASAVAAYPINRAARVEFTSGVSQLSFDQIVRSTAYSVNTGQVVLDTHA